MPAAKRPTKADSTLAKKIETRANKKPPRAQHSDKIKAGYLKADPEHRKRIEKRLTRLTKP